MSASTFIETFSGQAFYPLEPNPDDIEIAVIAHALSLQCRFGGHCREHYSVAEHSVRVSWVLQDWECSRRTLRWGLLHDAYETYANDIAAPVKRDRRLAGYRAVEAVGMAAVCERFRLPKKEPAEVRAADRVLLATEVRDLMPNKPANWEAIKDVVPLNTVIVPWEPREAKRKFLKRFVELYTEVGNGRP